MNGGVSGPPQSARPAFWEAHSRATQSGFHSNLCNDAPISTPNPVVELSSKLTGRPYTAGNVVHPFWPGTRSDGQRPICRIAHRRHRLCKISVFTNLQSEQRFTSVVSEPAADPIELCEVFATEVVDRSGWGGLYRVHRRRRWRRGGPDGPLRTGSGQIVLTGSVLRRHRHHLSRAALQRPSSGYDRTCPDVPPPI